MKELKIGRNDANQRLDRFVSKAVPRMSAALAQKYIRLKRIKLNGKRAQHDTRLQEGDVLQFYINDEFFDTPAPDKIYPAAPKLHIIYEDSNILLVVKAPGVVVHPNLGQEDGTTLVEHIVSYLYEKGEWCPQEEHSFTPALCNRIDRNTGGIVIAAKNAEALRMINLKIKNREIEKRYLAIVEGTPDPSRGVLLGYLSKDTVTNRVCISHTPKAGAKRCETRYETLASCDGLSLISCELITGRTHQIRAQFSHAGYPLLGDKKYGSENTRFSRKYQALYSYQLSFHFTSDSGALAYLDGLEFRVPHVDFVEEFFAKDDKK